MFETEETSLKFKELINVMRRLRAPDGCPWDREQDYMSLRRYIAEEAYELIEAIENEDKQNMCEECGDLLLQSVFVSCIAEEKNDFVMADVLDILIQKLIRRHPHVFGDIKADTSSQVLKNWEAIKIKEKEKKNADTSVMSGIPRGLPALLRAYRMQERAAKLGFDWKKGDCSSVFNKIEEEIGELKAALDSDVRLDVEEEIGDAMFALANLSRHIDANPEDLLKRSCVKFESRFRCVEALVLASGKSWDDFTLDDLEEFWRTAKKKEKEL